MYSSTTNKIVLHESEIYCISYKRNYYPFCWVCKQNCKLIAIPFKNTLVFVYQFIQNPNFYLETRDEHNTNKMVRSKMFQNLVDEISTHEYIFK